MSHPGQTLGRYELIARIGEGGMAEVHLARQRGPRAFEKLVVVKTVHPRLAAKPALAEALLEEARIAAKVRHPHVVDIYDLGEEGGTYFIAMEYLEGESLTSIIRAQRAKGGERLSPLRTAQVVCDCAAGLHAAHELRSLSGEPLELVHQDVTPGNVFVLYTGQAKLLDFGVAKVRTSDEAGLVKGKAGYLAPELFAKRAADRQSDVFALGVVLWESLTLRRLFSGATEADTFAKIRACDVPAPSTQVPGLPPELDAICARALARSREERYPTARALQDDLGALLRGVERNDYEAMATYMRRTFATHITARQELLRELDRGGAPPAGTLAALTATFDDRSPATPVATAAPAPATLGAKAIAGGKRLAPLPGPRARLQPSPSPTPSVPATPAPGPSSEAVNASVTPELASPVAAAEPATAPPPAALDGDDGIEELSGVIEEPSRPLEPAPPGELVPRPSPRPPTIDEPTAKGEVAPMGDDDLALPVASRSRRWWVGGTLGAVALVVIAIAVGRGGGETHAAVSPRSVVAADPVADVAPDAAVEAVAAAAGDPVDAGVEVDAAVPTSAPPPLRTAVVSPPERDPHKAAELAQAGLKQVMSGETARAITSFQAALRADRSHAPAYRGLGLAYEKQGNAARAARAYRDYLRLAPTARDAAAIRARLESLK